MTDTYETTPGVESNDDEDDTQLATLTINGDQFVEVKISREDWLTTEQLRELYPDVTEELYDR